MIRQTYESNAANAAKIEAVDDLVADRLQTRIAISDNARRMHKRYKKRLTKRLVQIEAFYELTE